MADPLTVSILKQRGEWRVDLFLNKITGSHTGVDSKGGPVTTVPLAPFTLKAGATYIDEFGEKETLNGNGNGTKFTVTDITIFKNKVTLSRGVPNIGKPSWIDIPQIKKKRNTLLYQILGVKLDRLGLPVDDPTNAAVDIYTKGTLNGSKNILTIGTGQFIKTAEFGGKAPTAAGSMTNNPSTIDQERITLAIFEALLGINDYKPKTRTDFERQYDFWQLCNGRLPGFTEINLSKIWGGIVGFSPDQREWYRHFLLQFNEIETTTKLPNNTFKLFRYSGEPENFMDFIEKEVITQGPPSKGGAAGTRTGDWPFWPGGKIAKKDAWNPADIWLVQPGRKYEKFKKDILNATTINQINTVLRTAFRGSGSARAPVDPTIAGISLKKSGKTLKYELVNLQIRPGQLRHVNYVHYEIRAPFKPKGNDMVPDKTTSYMYIKETGRDGKEATMTISGAGTNKIGLEFGGQGAAKLGRVPVELLNTLINELTPALPAGNNKVPDADWAKKNWPTDKAKVAEWNNKIKDLIEYSTGSESAASTNRKLFVLYQQDKDFGTPSDPAGKLIKRLKRASQYGKGTVESNNALIIMQAIQFGYLLLLIYKRTKGWTDDDPRRRIFDNWIEQLYYFAQKKGVTSTGARFGPFGKLY